MVVHLVVVSLQAAFPARIHWELDVLSVRLGQVHFRVGSHLRCDYNEGAPGEKEDQQASHRVDSSTLEGDALVDGVLRGLHGTSGWLLRHD